MRQRMNDKNSHIDQNVKVNGRMRQQQHVKIEGIKLFETEKEIKRSERAGVCV